MVDGETASGLSDPEDPDAVLIRLLRQLNVETDRFAEMFGEAHGLYRTDLNALVVIMDAVRGGDSISPGELARALQLSASATTAVLDRLETAGHARRRRSANDGRRIELQLPETTWRLGDELFRPLGAELERAWSSFDADERDTIVRFLTASIRATTTVRTRLQEDVE
ncbi:MULTISPECIES: MarR family winged helix-turn-helix transcriptional regulator [Prauserella salsuginis group]|uniref:MarR family winged helix-turn-helix transcriptional regulator n=1 Tax=Prauserella salsuginis TaxID=387889 RepID=A0ABW6G8Y3_9PSEU|nr:MULTISPECIES: MarR family transcriptional regulator [Prauserella salsuginis group]MCR3722502.1 DNA-binding transcriptional regulator, MarR family [Prauserella flava]MCR3736944.1 DNA-binding transcriptional regulator, MarR family [Prauserella salsuginis]